jgi:zinc transporter ZupT
MSQDRYEAWIMVVVAGGLLFSVVCMLVTAFLRFVRRDGQ